MSDSLQNFLIRTFNINQKYILSGVILITRLSHYDLCWPQITFDHQRMKVLLYSLLKLDLNIKHEVRKRFASEVSKFTRFSHFWPLALYKKKYKGFSTTLRWFHKLSFKIQLSFIFENNEVTTFADFDLWWPQNNDLLTSTNKENRAVVLNKVDPYIAHEVLPSFTFRVIMFTRLSCFDLWWQAKATLTHTYAPTQTITIS